MSSKHLFPNAGGLVVKYLGGLISWNPSLSLIPEDKVIFKNHHSRSKVAIISGGGAGHEPAWSGYVGHNMLAAAASGDIFASPSARQIESAIRSVPSDVGTILVITNYTGDCLHFGMACEKANAAGFQNGPVAVINCGDDVSVGKKGNGLVGRRGLPGQILVLKVLGAAAESGLPFKKLLTLGNALKGQLVSIATTLDHCHVPGRKEHAKLDATTIEIGTGPHNEPGFLKVSPQPSPEALVGMLMEYLTDESDDERAYVKFRNNDEVAVLVNNFGGMSVLEMGALTNEFLSQVPSHIRPIRVYTGVFETSLNAPAFSLTLCNLSATARNTGLEMCDILQFLDAHTDTAWEAVAGNQSQGLSTTSQLVKSPLSEPAKLPEIEKLYVNPKKLESSIRKACQRVIAAEPALTEWDTIMGDGDCGETFKTGSLELLQALDTGLASSGSLLKIFNTIATITETKMGGTLGAILSIFFNALTALLSSQSYSLVEAPWQACRVLETHTPARVGHRTIMDVLIPATKTLAESRSIEAAAAAAQKGAEGTKTLSPVLGRATYVGGLGGKELPPDPGAWGAMEAMRGIWEGWEDEPIGAVNGVNGVNGIH